ncbi:hypothetical protein PVT71_03045 [Salipiger sp. H15]|uniref:PepSY domain-containing protein n=1 Tax=Alloyangia sp. H15 TaxID=3029062 RepID=A0AAU8AHW1_9RHOB
MTALPTTAQRMAWPRPPSRARLVALLCGGLGALLPAPSTGQSQTCGPREAVVARLAETYGETRHSIGLGSNNAMMELFASDETGTWTITVTSAAGLTCLVASGLAFETLAETLPPEESDA